MPETFSPISWRNDQSPALNETNLNRIEVGVETLDDRIATLENGVVTPVTVPFATSVTIDATQGSLFRCVASGDLTLDQIVGGTDGQTIVFEVQASGAPRVLHFTGSTATVNIESGQWWVGVFRYLAAPYTIWLRADAATGTEGGGSGTDLNVLAPQNLPYAATITPDASAGALFRITAPGDFTLADPINGTDGQAVVVEVFASGGSRTVSFAAGYPSITIPVGSRWTSTLRYNSTTNDWLLATASNTASAVASVNGFTGAVALTADSIPDGSTKVTMTSAERTKLTGIASGATAYTGSDVRTELGSALLPGANITITPAGSGGSRTYTVAASGSTGYSTVQDEGTARTARSTINFVGAGVTATDDAANSRTLVTIPGGSGSGDAGVATTLYVSPTGNNSNSGLLASAPKQTVAAALAALPSGVGTVVALPGTHTVPAGGWTVDAGKQQLVGRVGTKFSATALTGTATAITVTGTVDPPWSQTITPIADFELIGPGQGTSVVGIKWDQPTVIGSVGAGPSHLSSRNVNVHYFGRGVQFGSQAYCIDCYNWDVWECGICVYAPDAITNGGERISFTSSTIFDSPVGCSVANSIGELVLNSCSLDYNATHLIVNNTMVWMFGCHVENDTTITTPDFTLAGNAGALSMFGGYILHNGDLGSGTQNEVIQNNASDTAGALFKGVHMTNLRNTSGLFSTGTGPTRIEDATSPDIAVFCTNVGATANLISDGGFEQTTVVDDWIASGGAAAPTTVTTQAHSGARSMSIVKTGASGVAAAVTIYVPIRRGARPLVEAWVRKTGTQTGTINTVMAFASLGITGTVKRTQAIATDPITLTSAALAWTWTGTGDPIPRAPMWATHLQVQIDLTTMNAGTVFVDDVAITTI